ncbi:hypothetical protein JCM17039_17220 [Blautia glucerasea]
MEPGASCSRSTLKKGWNLYEQNINFKKQQNRKQNYPHQSSQEVHGNQ